MKQILSTRFFHRCVVNPNYLSRYSFPDTKIFTKFKMYFITIQQGIRATQWIGFKRKQVCTSDIPKPKEKPPLQYRARQIVISLLSFSWQATFIIFCLSRCVFMLLPPARSSEGSCKGRFRIIRGWISVAGRKCCIFRNIFSTSWFFCAVCITKMDFCAPMVNTLYGSFRREMLLKFWTDVISGCDIMEGEKLYLKYMGLCNWLLWFMICRFSIYDARE